MNKGVIFLISELGYGGAESDLVRLADFVSREHNVTIALISGHEEYSSGAIFQGSNINIEILGSNKITGCWVQMQTLLGLGEVYKLLE